MIRFNCPHCGNEFAVRDTYAGRDGWCRVCKELVLVPTEDGKGPHLDDLPAEERISRLRAKLKYAATQADTYKQIALRIWAETDALLLGRDNKDQQLTPDGVEASLAAWHAAWEARGAETSPPSVDADAMAKLESEVTRLREVLEAKTRGMAEANEETDRLRAAVASLESVRKDTDDGTTTRDVAKDDETDALRADLSAAQSALEEANAELERLRAAFAVIEADHAPADQSAANDGAVRAQDAEGLREELNAARIALADSEGSKSDTESALNVIRAELSAAQSEREEAQRATRVLQDEVESLRVELDAALHAKAGGAIDLSADANGVGDPAEHAEGHVPPRERGGVNLPDVPAWHDAPIVVTHSGPVGRVPADEMEVVEAEIEGLDPLESDAMMASYLHFLSDAPKRGK